MKILQSVPLIVKWLRKWKLNNEWRKSFIRLPLPSVKPYLLSVFLLTSFSVDSLASTTDVWQKVEIGSALILMRHALAPGNGDPTEFDVHRCETQRNLSQAGRLQAQRIGKTIKSNGINDAEIFTSQWCRCIDTGIEIGFSEPIELPLLNSFYQDRSTAELQTEQLRTWVKNRLTTSIAAEKGKAVILVTHQVNITALTGLYPDSGEMVFLTFENDEIQVLSPPTIVAPCSIQSCANSA